MSSKSNCKGERQGRSLEPAPIGNILSNAKVDRKLGEMASVGRIRFVSRCASTLDIVSTWDLARQLNCSMEATYEQSPRVHPTKLTDVDVHPFATTVKSLVESGVHAKAVIADVSSMRYLFIDEDELIATSGPGVTVKSLLAASADLGLEPVGFSDISDDLSRLLCFEATYAAAFLPARSIRDAQIVPPDGTIRVIEPNTKLISQPVASQHFSNLGVVSRLSVKLRRAVEKNYGVLCLELQGAPHLFFDALERASELLPTISLFVRIVRQTRGASLIAVSIVWPDSQPDGARVFARMAQSGRLLASLKSSGATYDFMSAHHRLVRELVSVKFQNSDLSAYQKSVFVLPLKAAIAAIRASMDKDRKNAFWSNHTPTKATSCSDIMWSINS